MSRDPSRDQRPRERALLRAKLLAGAAAALHSACAADKPSEPPTNGPAGSSGGNEPDTADGGSSSQYNASSGYLVVDMLPTPSRCAIDLSTQLTSTAVFRPSQKGNDVVFTLRAKNGGKLPLPANLGPPPMPQMVQVASGGASSDGATTKELGNDLEISFLYDGTSRAPSIRMMVMCESDGGWIMITAVADPDRQIPGAPLAVSITPN